MPDHDSGKPSIIDNLICKPPKGYVFIVMAAQDSHYDLFMRTLLKRGLDMGLRVLQVVTEARNRQVMEEMAQLQGVSFQILEVSYGQKALGQHSCSPHLHEINIMLRSLRNSLVPNLVMFEALTPLLIDFSPREVVQFFKESVEESIKNGSVEFFLVHAETADSVTMNQLFSLAQGIVTLTTSRGKHYLTVQKATGVELPYNPIEYVPIMSGEHVSDWQIILNW
jgi:archaellum biogenesis ATPase FlaH